MATPSIGVRVTHAVFRAHNPEWAWAPTSGEGARKHGGRFNRIGQAALYTSLSALTAIREASPLGQPMQPLTLCQYDDLACANWMLDMLQGKIPVSQQASVQLIARGYRGIIVRSFAQGATTDDLNIVFWDWSDTSPKKVQVIDSDSRLPRNQTSWPSA